MQPWEKIAKAVDARAADQKHFPGFTWKLLASWVNARQPKELKPLSESTVRKWGTAGASGLSEWRIHTLEELLELPNGWIENGKDDEVPEPRRIHLTAGIENEGVPLIPVSVYRGGTATMWHLTSDHAETMTVRLFPGYEDDTFVQIQDGSLIPAASPSEIIAFEPCDTVEADAMHLLRSKEDADVFSIRIYDAEEDAFVDPRRRQPSLIPSQWDVIGLATSKHRANGLRFPKK